MNYFQWLFVSWQGRVNRQLYWMSIALLCLLPLVPKILSLLFGFNLWELWFDFYFLCTAGPLISLVIKRLHDTEHDSLWLLKIFPLLGLIISLLIIKGVFPERLRIKWQQAGNESLGKQVAFTVFPFIPFFWFFIVLMFIPGTDGDNRYGKNPIKKLEVSPELKKIDLAIEMIEPWTDKNFPFALSLQSQLEWCQLMFSGFGSEKPAGELSLVIQAEKNFDDWNKKAHLIRLLSEIEKSAKVYI